MRCRRPGLLVVSLLVFSLREITPFEGESVRLENSFVLLKQNVTYVQARDLCLEYKKVGVSKYWLASDITKVENEMLYGQLVRRQVRRAWIGANRMFDVEDDSIKFYKQEKERGGLIPIKTFFWGPEEPNNFRNHKERCVEMRVLEKNDGLRNWNDAPCSHRNWFVCRSERAKK